MAEPRITGIEVHTYTYTLNDLGTDYNGFNLVYVPGSTVVQTNHIIRILTDVGLVGEYAGGSAADYAILPSFTHYLLGKHALERERIYADVKRALRQVARIGLAPVDIALWDLAGKYYQTQSTACWAATKSDCPATPAPIMATRAAASTAPRPMRTLPYGAATWATPPSKFMVHRDKIRLTMVVRLLRRIRLV
jgi:hypothetical protein